MEFSGRHRYFAGVQRYSTGMQRVAIAGLSPVVLLLSCKVASETLPGWDSGTAEPAPVAAADADQAPAGVAQDGDPVAGPARQSEGGPEGGSEPAAPAGAADATSEPIEVAPAASEPSPLPKPLHHKINKTCGNDPGVGQRLKGFKLKTPRGKTISPSSYRGRVLLVNFWGTWCKPCLKELPEFDRLYRRYRKHGMTLVAVATDEDAGAVQEFVASKKIAAKIAIGGESYAGQYGSDKFPFSFVVDPKGVIKASYRGYKPECSGKLEADLRTELQKRNK